MIRDYSKKGTPAQDWVKPRRPLSIFFIASQSSFESSKSKTLKFSAILSLFTKEIRRKIKFHSLTVSHFLECKSHYPISKWWELGIQKKKSLHQGTNESKFELVSSCISLPYWQQVRFLTKKGICLQGDQVHLKKLESLKQKYFPIFLSNFTKRSICSDFNSIGFAVIHMSFLNQKWVSFNLINHRFNVAIRKKVMNLCSSVIGDSNRFC